MKYILNLLRRWFGFSKTYYAVVTEHDGGPEGSRGGPVLWEQYLSFAQDYKEAVARKRMLGDSFGKSYIVKLKYHSGEYFTNHIVPMIDYFLSNTNNTVML